MCIALVALVKSDSDRIIMNGFESIHVKTGPLKVGMTSLPHLQTYHTREGTLLLVI